MMEDTDKDKFYFGAILAWGIFFVFVYSYFLQITAPIEGGRIFNSPDETANYLFTKQLIDTNHLIIAEPENSKYGDILYPRAVRVMNDGSLLPGSFTGIIIIYGLLGKFFGSWIILLLTPIFSFFGVVYLYKFFREIFSTKIAFLSSLLLLVFPGWWYYNSRSMFHNILFVDLTIFCLYNLFIYIKKDENYRLLASALFFGLAILIRTSEILWLLPLFVAIFIMKKKIFSVKPIIYGPILLVVILWVIVYFQNKIFGNAITGGYIFQNQNTALFHNIIQYILPFGFHPKRAIIHFYQYYFILFWWYAIPSAIGYLIMLKKFFKASVGQKWYCVFFALISAFLIIYYGSWDIADNLDPDKVTIGTSYVRYWMPLYVFSLPFVGYFFRKFFSKIHNANLKVLGVCSFLSIFVYCSYQLTWVSTEESLGAVKKRISEYYVKREIVANIVPENAIIMTERSDKIFFPQYRVISQWKEKSVLENIKKITEDNNALYYYTFLNDADVEKFDATLSQYNLQLANKTKVYGNEYLYKVVSK